MKRMIWKMLIRGVCVGKGLGKQHAGGEGGFGVRQSSFRLQPDEFPGPRWDPAPRRQGRFASHRMEGETQDTAARTLNRTDS